MIIIGKIGKINEVFITSQNNEFNLPEENTYIFVDLDKIDYIIELFILILKIYECLKQEYEVHNMKYINSLFERIVSCAS